MNTAAAGQIHSGRMCACLRACVLLVACMQTFVVTYLNAWNLSVGQGCQHEAKVVTLWRVLEAQVMKKQRR